MTFLIVNRFSIRKKFWKAETKGFPTIPSNSIYVGDVEGYFDLWHFRHASTYIAFDGMVGKPKSQLSKTFCRLKIGWILRKLWVKTCVCSFDTFDMHRHYSPQLFWAAFNTFRHTKHYSPYSTYWATFNTFDMSNSTLYWGPCMYFWHLWYT